MTDASGDPQSRYACDPYGGELSAANISGSGSSMDAYRFEQRTGTLLSPKGHGQKLLNRRTQLGRIFRSLERDDRRIAGDILIDIQDALGGP